MWVASIRTANMDFFSNATSETFEFEQRYIMMLKTRGIMVPGGDISSTYGPSYIFENTPLVPRA